MQQADGSGRKTLRGDAFGCDQLLTADGGRVTYARRSVVRRLARDASADADATSGLGGVCSAAAVPSAASGSAAAAPLPLASTRAAAPPVATSASGVAGAGIQFEGAVFHVGCNADAALTSTSTSVSPCVDAASAPVRRRLVGKQSGQGRGLRGEESPANESTPAPAVVAQRPTQRPAIGGSVVAGRPPGGAT